MPGANRLGGVKHAALAVGIGLLLTLPACRGAGSPTTSSLDGTWILQSGTNAGVALSLVPGREISLVIAGEKVTGRACNLISGTISISGNAVALNDLAMTEMACEGPIMTTEAAYFAALGQVETATRSGKSLALSGPRVTLRYLLHAPVADAPLLGTHWALETLVDGEVASSTVGETPTLVLAPDGSAMGSTGCRTFTASYRLDGDRLNLYDMSAQTAMCTVDLEPQDQLVREVLTGGATASVSGAMLTLTGPDGRGLGYRVASAVTPDASPTIANPDPVEPSLPGDQPLPLDPPIVTIDGVAGRVVTWCGTNACADGAIDAGANPRVTHPGLLVLPATVTMAAVTVQADAQSAGVHVPIAADGQIGPIPVGGWRYLLVQAQLSDGGNAFYAWSLVP